MNLKSLKYLLLLICLNLACSNSATSQKNNPAENSNKTATKAGNKIDIELQKQIEQLALSGKGRVGVTATILETGETASLNGKERFPMQSVYKFPIALAILKQIDNRKLKLDQKIQIQTSDFVGKSQRSPLRDENPNGVELTIEQILKFAVSESDGTASDVLFKLVGSSEGMREYLDKISIREIAAVNTEKEIGTDWETQYRNYASPEAAVELLRAFYEHHAVSEQNQSLLMKMMIETPTGLNRLKGLLPEKTIVAHKTGTSGSKDGITAATNDIGIVTMPNGKHLAIAVFVSDSPADEKTREETIAKIAKAAWDKWNK